jgi:hypothetical protein
MSALGHKQTYAVQNVMSALPPKADMCSAKWDVRFVPIADIAPPQKRHASCCKALALLVLSFAADGRSFRSGVELVWLAETSVSAERCAALFDGKEPTVSPARSSVGSTIYRGQRWPNW